MSQDKITIIVPVLNEEGLLPDSLRQFKLTSYEELIVVDGGSTDNTVSIAREFTDKVFVAKTGRASVMNFGAQQSTGKILLFLHADCVLPEKGFQMIRETLRDRSIAAGGFFLSIDHPKAGFRIIESAANLRARSTSLIYGDQGMFLRKSVFDHIGGFADMPLMEDIEISGRLKKQGNIVFVQPPVKVSPRRWLREGIIFTTIRDWTIAFSYKFLGISPDRLIKYYKDIR
ncbi:MAG: glycosyltransferase [Nitrospiraceae bacterium]|nr:MAG: glycosyltransferase [Nitrospiraceae bacterium]